MVELWVTNDVSSTFLKNQMLLYPFLKKTKNNNPSMSLVIVLKAYTGPQASIMHLAFSYNLAS